MLRPSGGDRRGRDESRPSHSDISPERSEPRMRSQEGCALAVVKMAGRYDGEGAIATCRGRVELPLDRKRRGGNGHP